MERGVSEFVVNNTALASLAMGSPDKETMAALHATYHLQHQPPP